MRYLICKKQCGVGCDYTIGCGMLFEFIDADSRADAQEKAIWPDGRDGCCVLEGEQALCELLIVPSNSVITVNVPDIITDVVEQWRDTVTRETEAKERAELARLQAKYSITRS